MSHPDDKRFWDIIAHGCPRNVDDFGDWNDTLSSVLAKLPLEDIATFDLWMDYQTNRAYRRDLWSAASLINGGASDDGFYYFRLWLLGMGKQVFENALVNPDTLADVVNADADYYESEIYGVARAAWGLATGNDYLNQTEEYDALLESGAHLFPVQKRPPELQGETVDSDILLPRLTAMYITEEDDIEDEDFEDDWE